MGLRNSSLYWAFHNMTIKSDVLWNTGSKQSPSSPVILLPLMVAPPPHRKAYVELKFPGILSALTFHRGDYRGFQRVIHFAHHQLLHRLMTSLSSSGRGVLVWQWQCLGRRNTHRHSGHTVPQASRLLDVCHTHNSQHYYHHNIIIFIIIMIFLDNRSKLNRKWKIVPVKKEEESKLKNEGGLTF